MFKLKNINTHLLRVFKKWESNIKDETVKKLVNEHTIITGGCIASMLTGEEIRDYDLYFTNEETCVAVAKYYTEMFIKQNPKTEVVPSVKVEEGRVKVHIQSKGIASTTEPEGYKYFEGEEPTEGEQYVKQVTDAVTKDVVNAKGKPPSDKDNEFHPVFLSSNAISLTNKVQLITRFHGSPEDIHKNYDYVHCTNYWTSKNQTLVTNKEALESLLSKELQYVGSLYPVASLFRMRKFISRGWNMNAGQIFKIAFQVSSLDLTDVEVLQEQLIGVDVAYFIEVIQMIKAELKSDPNKTIDQAYIVGIIDSIF